jgi:hypothetical protein
MLGSGLLLYMTYRETETILTKYGVSLSLSQWKVLCSATQVMDDLISRAKDGELVDWRYHLGEDVYVMIFISSISTYINVSISGVLGVIMTNTEIKFHILLFKFCFSVIWEKTSTSTSKPLNWQFTSGSTSCLMENGRCILRR